MVKKLLLEFIIGCILSVASAICFGLVYTMLYMMLEAEVFFGGDKAGPFFILFLGVPIGALLGISLVDKLLFKSQGYNIFGLVLGFILSQFGVVLGIFLLDSIGNTALFFIPLIIGLLSLVGYNVKLLKIKK